MVRTVSSIPLLADAQHTPAKVNHGAPELAASAPTAAPAAAPAAMIHPSIVPTGFVASGGIEEKLDRVLTAIADIKKEVASIKEGSDGPQIDVSSMSADLGVLSKAYLTKRHYAICKHNLHNPLNWKPLPHLETGKLRPDDSTIYFEDMGDLLIGSEAQTISKWLKFYGLDSAAAHYGHHRLERDRVTLLSYFTKTSDPALDPSRSFVVVG